MDGLAEAGIQFQDYWLRPQRKPAQTEFDNRKFGYCEMKKWLGKEWGKSACTAVLAHKDDAALGAMDALQEAGKKVPHEVSVIGFDGLGLTHPSCGPITSVHVPLYEIGARGTRLLIDIIQQPLTHGNHGEGPVCIELPAHIEPGNSTAKVMKPKK
jgi:DNA-binding LacI/PurR family transcriptional regulator